MAGFTVLPVIPVYMETLMNALCHLLRPAMVLKVLGGVVKLSSEVSRAKSSLPMVTSLQSTSHRLLCVMPLKPNMLRQKPQNSRQ